MNGKLGAMNRHLAQLIQRYPALNICQEPIIAAFEELKSTFSNDRKLFLCGNGGSGADADHIAAELLKGFLLKRPLNEFSQQKLNVIAGKNIAANLQEGLPAISLHHPSTLLTAVANDNCPEMIFAQPLYALAQSGDSLLGISTSGNSKNVINAFHVAKLKSVTTILLTGKNGGELSQLADISIKVPAETVIEIQEYHLPIYHTLCAMTEEYFFDS